MPHALTSPVEVAPLLVRLRTDYPDLRFTIGADDHWDTDKTITYTLETPPCALLHELAHAVLGHRHYTFDIDLLAMERAAWEYARSELAPQYGVTITTDDAEDALDTYRAWLHNRSLCPDCHLSGLQRSDFRYLCVACGTNWRANAAKTCALRRFR